MFDDLKIKGPFDDFSVKNGKLTYPINKNTDVWIGKAGGGGASGNTDIGKPSSGPHISSGLGASVGFTWKFGKRR